MFRSRLYPIVDVESARRHGWAPDDLARALQAGGADLIQIRAKTLASRDLLALCDRVVREIRAPDTRIVVNDRADVAFVSGADGVHVGQDDLEPHAVRRLLGERALVGWSTHTRDQIDDARDRSIDYLAVGPVFGTRSKHSRYEPVGLDLVRYARAQCGGRPVVAIGGISLATAPSVVEAGASAVAVIADLLEAGSPADRVRAFLDVLAA